MTRESLFHQWALARVDEVPLDLRDDYEKYVKNACGLIITSGATQTVAFLRSKIDAKKNKSEDVFRWIAEHVAGDGAPAQRDTTRDYMAYTRWLRRALTHLKLAIEIERATNKPKNPEVTS